MRVSSDTAPLALNGTLKSTRMNTRRPAISSSEIVLIAMVCSLDFPDPARAAQKKARPVRGARRMLQKAPKGQEKSRDSYARGLSPMSVVTRLMISVARATICFGS